VAVPGSGQPSPPEPRPGGPQHPPAQYPPAQYPPAQYPPAQYPPAQYPPAQYPPPDRLGGVYGLGPNTRCYAHPDRLAGAVCRSCNRPICADCMVAAPVGWHCRQCVRRSSRQSPVVRYRPGGPGAQGVGRYPVTVVLIAACVAVYIGTIADPNLTGAWEEWGVAVQAGEWYRLFTSIFIHYSVLHIGLDMVSLFFVGRIIEPVVGPWRYLALFLVTGFGGSVAFYLTAAPLDASAGASGAIFGLFGAFFVLARRARTNTSGIVGLIAINLFLSFSVPGIAWEAHIGGLLVGLAVASGLGLARGRPHEVVSDVAVFACATVVLSLLMLLAPGSVNLG